MTSATTFWLGLGLSIPIAIAVNLVTPYLQNFASTLSVNQRNKLQTMKERETSFAEALSTNRDSMTLYFISKNNLVTRFLLYTLDLSLVGVFLVVSSRFISPGSLLFHSRLTVYLAGVSAVFVGLLYLLPALNEVRKVKYLLNYILGKDERLLAAHARLKRHQLF